MYANEGEDVEEKKRPAAEDGGRTSLLQASDVSQTRRPLFFRTETCARPRGPPGGSSSSLLSYARLFLNGAGRWRRA